MNIEFKEGVVCFAARRQWYSCNDVEVISENQIILNLGEVVEFSDFQLNTIKQGDYIPKSELDTEDKYNRAVDALEILGVHSGKRHSYYAFKLSEMFKVSEFGLLLDVTLTAYCKRKITFKQLNAIGELKRLMNERDKSNHSVKPNSSVSKVNRDIERNQTKNKSKQAYEILESLDYDYDLVKQQWFRKEWV